MIKKTNVYQTHASKVSAQELVKVIVVIAIQGGLEQNAM